MSKRLFKLGLVLTVALAGSALIGIMPAFAGTADTIVVHPGQSIQRAVNHAQPGDTIVVEAGVYHQSVQVKHTNDLTLKGAGSGAHGTVLMPPVDTSARTNACERFQSGICILGAGGNVVDGTRVTGFRVTGFAGFGIVALGTSNSMFDHNAAINDGEYGMTSFNSTGNSYEHNLAVGSDEAGFYYGDSPNANGTFANNVSRGNLFGFFLRDAAHGTLHDNVATGNCDGFMFLDTGSGVGGLWTAEHNIASRNNEFCPANEEGPAISGVGMAILGDDGVVLRENQVIGNVPSGDAQISGGIVVLSSEPLGGNVENGNQIVQNTAFHNKPKDVIWDGNGTGNTFTDNNCGKSAPASICN